LAKQSIFTFTMHRIYIAIIISLTYSKVLLGQIPAGYYNTALGIAGGTALQNALTDIISSANQVWYTNTWNAFYTTDVKPNGKVWDIYSWKPTGTQAYEYSLGNGQCGTYNKEGDCYNREHIWPQSLFNSAEPMVSDMHSLFASDGYVNNMRANFPFGTVNTLSPSNSTNPTANNSKLGYGNNYSGYSDKVFEPIDSIKGDIARAIFYFSTRYKNSTSSFTSWPMANGVALTQDAVGLLLLWHQLDPVSAKEINRNNAIYNLQNNRNPFVDYPEMVNCIWSTANCTALSINQLHTTQLQISMQSNRLYFTNYQSSIADKVCIYNSNGGLVQQWLQYGQASIDIGQLPSGIYCLQITNKGNTQHALFAR
jgi:endonuclease I